MGYTLISSVMFFIALSQTATMPLTSIIGPLSWPNIWGVAYHDTYDMLYIGGPTSGQVAYGVYDGDETVNWTIFDTVESVCGLACYQDNALYAITQDDPFNPGPFYLYSWQLSSSGIPILPAEVYQLGEPFIGTFGGCEWDGDNLWLLDQNFIYDNNSTIYQYDVTTHSILSSWDYSELGGVGLATVWDSGELNLWVSDWYGGYKIVEHTTEGTLTGRSYDISTNSTDVAFKYEADFSGSGFFVGNHSASTIDFYNHTLSALERNSWGSIKASF